MRAFLWPRAPHPALSSRTFSSTPRTDHGPPQFELPEQFIFSTDIPIYISHVNQGGHLDNAQLLTLVSEARVRFFRWLGYPGELSIEGLSIVVGDMMAQYKSEAFYGETMQVDMVPDDFNKYGFDLVFRLQDKASGREVARGKTGVVFVDHVRFVVFQQLALAHGVGPQTFRPEEHHRHEHRAIDPPADRKSVV